MGRYEVARSTIDGTQHAVFDSAVIAYADTNEHALTTNPLENIEYYKELVFEIKVTSGAGTTAQTLTLGFATSNYEVTGAEAIAAFESGYWEEKEITLNAGADVLYYKTTIAAADIKGKFLYSKYTYGADPTGDPTVEVKLNFI